MQKTREDIAKLIPLDLVCYKDLIMDSLRTAAIPVSPPKGVPGKQGTTKVLGQPDVPKDASWRFQYLEDSPLDGPCFWMQINLAEIPNQARIGGVPEVGMVWLLIDCSSSSWKVIVHFDDRSSSHIDWMTPERELPGKAIWTTCLMAPASIEAVDATGDADLEVKYCDFAQSLAQTYEKPYFGGYAFPIQSDEDDFRGTAVCSIPSSIGDNALIHLHYTAEKGWWGTIESH
ncbi:DUF1963 domain-containing protein [Pseudomonas viridiflava]|uniref:DUF1963 domain-containing protein n=1 Tax=Pseudomonas viridiflava TaxID=33069 RepID=UPI0018E5B778|nr:DUF1963 domain-containing protein [Pseudomonas viridiflava]MBI6727220.1 DUF1963 domain-containing protein [Pseudomonas viridiflava]